MADKVTIKDVARIAGVSISTVSRVMNNSAHVENDLKERVLKAAADTGYTPNEIARSLKTSNTSLVAFLVSNTADPFFTFIGRGIEEVMFQNGYSLIYCSTSFSDEREAVILNTLFERRVEGIIVNTVGNNDEIIGRISQYIPIVLSNRNIAATNFVGDFMDYDNMGGVIRLTKHLTDIGHRKIAFISGPTFLSTVKERLSGFIEAMRRVGINVDENYPYLVIREKTYTYNDGYEATRELMKREDKPTALVASNTEMALGALQYCKEAGISIPDDLSVVCFGEISHHKLMYVDLTHVSTDLMGLGNRIGEMLIQRIATKGTPQVNRELRFDTPLVIGNSTKPVD